ncbi:oxidoreductase [Geotalea uraniireducens]|uniref:Oxidoreductase n=1 Tax=Geotalea uraniireducens TaxID=351604 RepID=A0ABM8EK01_9BACT|nr:SDR family oxidoreductase [Geotalea uraniireducens]BDV42777.1 oxidoreductase [Geotalea uraniireducens]
MSNQLTGKTAIVTGASSGIGRATALALARDGAAVVLFARREERLTELATEITAAGGKALTVTGDAGNETDIDRLLARAVGWSDGGGRYDIVVANAGRGLAGGILNSDEAAWQEIYRTNVLGVARLLRRAGQYLVGRRQGDIVVIGSAVGRNISPFSGFYGSSKFAVGAIAEALRREVCAHGVRVSLVMPGIVVSGFQGVAGYDEENFGKSVAQFGKLLEPQAIADGIHWLLTLPPHVNVNEIMIRPTGQTFP